MTYDVYWRKRSLLLLRLVQFLAAEKGGDEEAVLRAADEINRLLAESPEQQRESRDGNERVLIVNPLTVVYEVFPEQNTVVIYRLVHHAYRAGNG